MQMKIIYLIAGFFTLQLFAGSVVAQTYPSKTIKVIVPYTPGGSVDNTCRLITDQLQKQLGQAVVVENKPGANGAIGVGEVARAAPDGYTLLVTNSSSITINPQLYKQITYRASDFAPITMVIGA